MTKVISTTSKEDYIEYFIFKLERLGFKNVKSNEVTVNPLYAALFEIYIDECHKKYKNKALSDLKEEIEYNMEKYAVDLKELVFSSDNKSIGD